MMYTHYYHVEQSHWRYRVWLPITACAWQKHACIVSAHASRDDGSPSHSTSPFPIKTLHKPLVTSLSSVCGGWNLENIAFLRRTRFFVQYNYFGESYRWNDINRKWHPLIYHPLQIPLRFAWGSPAAPRDVPAPSTHWVCTSDVR